MKFHRRFQFITKSTKLCLYLEPMSSNLINESQTKHLKMVNSEGGEQMKTGVRHPLCFTQIHHSSITTAARTFRSLDQRNVASHEHFAVPSFFGKFFSPPGRPSISLERNQPKLPEIEPKTAQTQQVLPFLLFKDMAGLL